jgi:hypothetical protein
MSMSINSDDSICNLGREWSRCPEPPFPEKDPQTILDCNIEGQAWLYNSGNEVSEWLVYDGETADVLQ